MDSFPKETEDAELNIRQVTKRAFTQAWKFLSVEAFVELSDVVVKSFYENEAIWVIRITGCWQWMAAF